MAKTTRGKKKMAFRKNPVINEWIKAFLIAVGVLILIRFFLFGFMTVSGSAMEKTLLPGDILLITKYRYGARMPMRVVPQKLINFFFSTDTLPPVKQFPYWRFPGYEKPQPGHLVQLNIPAPHQIPIDRRTKVVKRLMAGPGDTIQVRNGELKVNQEIVENLPSMQWNYRVQLRSDANLDSFLINNEIEHGNRIAGRNTYLFPLTEQKADSLKKRHEVLRLQRFKSTPERGFSSPFGKYADNWTADDFGPVIIPYKGMKIELNSRNFHRYYYTLLYHERQKILIRNDSVFIREKFVSEYTFRNNYYFFMGDNRHNTSDSRVWGFVPENHITGKVEGVFLSFDTHAPLNKLVRYNRLFVPTDQISQQVH